MVDDQQISTNTKNDSKQAQDKGETETEENFKSSENENDVQPKYQILDPRH